MKKRTAPPEAHIIGTQRINVDFGLHETRINLELIATSGHLDAYDSFASVKWDEFFPGPMIIRCNHCGQWAARKTACKHCGAPV